ncbi:sugar-phosphatase [Alteromonadaceae bacterium 2753L.S.0a.02]|nr:sugar-phosphatase [Alteromonadaceae bacterium 2753L.S.0a.02]
MTNKNTTASAVVFDMDGVLIDSAAVIERGWKAAAKLYNREVSEDDIRNHIHGQPGPHTIKALFSDLPLSAQQEIQAYVIDYETTADYDAIPGVKALVHALYDAEITLALVTSAWQEKIDTALDVLQAHSYFPVIVQRDDVARGKPHPDPYLLAAERLGVPASDMIVFEDAHSGVKSAVSAGAYCVGIGDSSLVTSGADFVVSDFSHVSLQADTEASVASLVFPDRKMLVLKESITAELE